MSREYPIYSDALQDLAETIRNTIKPIQPNFSKSFNFELPQQIIPAERVQNPIRQDLHDSLSTSAGTLLTAYEKALSDTLPSIEFNSAFSEALASSFKVDVPKLSLFQESFDSLSASMKEITSAYTKALSFDLSSMEFTQTIRTAMEAYSEQIINIAPLAEAASSIAESLSSVISDSVIHVADYYRPYMTDEQIEEIEEAIPELTAPETRVETPRLSLAQIKNLLVVLISVLQLCCAVSTGQQLDQLITKQDAEIAILSDLSATTHEMNDILQRIADALEDADPSGDLVSQEPDDIIQADGDIDELPDQPGHDSDIDGHDEYGDAQ